jgi:hypothetical protein
MMSGLYLKYFVLKPNGQDAYAKASRAAMRAYAKEIKQHDSGMADSLNEWAYNAETFNSDTPSPAMLAEDAEQEVRE